MSPFNLLEYLRGTAGMLEMIIQNRKGRLAQIRVLHLEFLDLLTAHQRGTYMLPTDE